MDYNSLIGRVVYSKAGRDSKKSFVILEVIDKDYVYIVDGNLRKIEKPKRKKIKHLQITDYVSDQIKELIMSGNNISNSKIRKYLENREAILKEG
ncbi:KOW domain-containing RNA-binding protein [Clostridium aestuarii]|uniref:KOW domain-containing RNA-binding protein n=1 Tax=Clostridium aestuarii TaxID=338193 RepID=A0ABT4CZV9_9CLOT|nr:KOW domain-containing RNA-binding protein [Clostridium aestuarii]MCY6483475.1 KOW domain-containing RNA-binding protein [Clostridium aestuarii]